MTSYRSLVFTGTSVSSTYKTSCHDVAELCLKVALHTTTLTNFTFLYACTVSVLIICCTFHYCDVNGYLMEFDNKVHVVMICFMLCYLYGIYFRLHCLHYKFMPCTNCKLETSSYLFACYPFSSMFL